MLRCHDGKRAVSPLAGVCAVQATFGSESRPSRTAGRRADVSASADRTGGVGVQGTAESRQLSAADVRAVGGKAEFASSATKWNEPWALAVTSAGTDIVDALQPVRGSCDPLRPGETPHRG
jgi:hypothetical protein